ncbi:hypothetical protein J7L48_05660 [bacterium]|nr:hypothetical protein [bacterium]
MKKLRIDKKLLDKMCDLAKLDHDPGEEESLLKDFGEIMAMIETISNVDFPMKDERMIFHQVINQFSSTKKYECDSEQIIEKFPHKRDDQLLSPPVSGNNDE